MLQSLFKRAEATVDNVIAVALARALVAIPFLVAAGFATAGLALYLYREFGDEAGNWVMAGIFCFVGLITAGVVTARSRGATSRETGVADVGGATDGNVNERDAPLLDPMDKEVVAAALAAVGPLALPMVLRAVVRNLPLVAAVAAAGFVLSRQSGQEPTAQVQPAE